jgi:hypothetical protein
LPTVTVRIPVLDPQIVVPALIVAVSGGLTTTVDAVELAAAHTPLCTTALYWVVVVKLLYVYGELVLAMFDQVAPPSVDDCQFRIFPVCTPRVIAPLLLP